MSQLILTSSFEKMVNIYLFKTSQIVCRFSALLTKRRMQQFSKTEVLKTVAFLKNNFVRL